MSGHGSHFTDVFWVWQELQQCCMSARESHFAHFISSICFACWISNISIISKYNNEDLAKSRSPEICPSGSPITVKCNRCLISTAVTIKAEGQFFTKYHCFKTVICYDNISYAILKRAILGDFTGLVLPKFPWLCMWMDKHFYIPGPLFTKQTDVLPQDLVRSRSREIRV